MVKYRGFVIYKLTGDETRTRWYDTYQEAYQAALRIGNKIYQRSDVWRIEVISANG